MKRSLSGITSKNESPARLPIDGKRMNCSLARLITHGIEGVLLTGLGRVFLAGIFLFVFKGLNFMQAQNSPTPSSGSPNLIIILADDLGYQDVGFNGCEDIPTPHIDRIAAEGMTFTQAYVSYAVCGPSRAGLITGRYQDRFGFGRNPLFAPNDPEMGLPKSEETLAEVLQKANYSSVAIGKWHLGAHPTLRPLERGFDDFFGFLSGGHDYFPENWTLEDEYEVKSQFGAYRTKLLRDEVRIEETEYLTDALSREAVNYIEKYQDSSFFMYLAYNAPHTPLQATEKYLSRFEAIEDPRRKTYAAMVSAVDDGVGEILDKLEELNISENTIVVFLSDNGGPERKNASDNGILRGGKSDLFEGGIRVPFAMKWPAAIPPGNVYEEPIISLDIFATVVAQVQKPLSLKHPLDGVNLLPFILGKRSDSPHDFLFWRKFDKLNYAVRNASGNKMISSKEQGRFFHLETDISETRALSGADNPDADSLKRAYQNWVAKMLDPIFLGLLEDKEYSKKHPQRFKRPD
jgi:arylsulfatase A-like enzyme